MATKILGDPALNLQVVKQRTTVVVEPISQSGSEYDSAEITTVVTMDNNQSEEVEFILPYPTVQFSASLAVTSAGDEFYKERITRVGRITGDLKRIKPYIQRLGLSPDSYDTGKELKAIAKQFRAGTLKLPAGLITVKIQLSAVINASTNADGIKMYSFKAYSPLPAFSLSNQRTPLTLAVLFKGDESIHTQIIKREVANPFGDNTNPITEILDQSLGEDISFYWKWQADPVVTFEYHY